jgi:hypothetical protein
MHVYILNKQGELYISMGHVYNHLSPCNALRPLKSNSNSCKSEEEKKQNHAFIINS